MDVLHPNSYSLPDSFDFSNFRPVNIPSRAFVQAKDVAKAGKYTLVGENHRDAAYSSDVVIPLLETGYYDNVFLEALLRGHIDDTDDSREMPGKVHDFDYNVDKYRRIIETAEKSGAEVHGLDPEDGRKESGYLELRDWADYILENDGGKNLILIGSTHVFDAFHLAGFEYGELSNISIENFLPDDDTSTVALARPGRELENKVLSEGFYRLEDLPDVLPEKFQDEKGADFIRVSTNSFEE